MALSTYSELIAAVNSWVNSGDITANIPDFIKLAEARLATEFKTQHLIVDTTITVDSESKALPTNYKGAVSAYLDTSPKTRLDYFTPDEFASRWASSEVGKPLGYTVKGQTIYFGPAPDSSYDCILSHYATPDLETDLTNSLLTNYPNLYLWASVVEAKDWLEEDSMKYEAKYLAALAKTEDEDVHGALAIQLGNCP